MTTMYKSRTFLWLALTLAVFSVVVTAISAAEDQKPSGTMAIESTSVAMGVGVNWGEGLLTLNDGRHYRFSVKGLEVGSLGASKIDAEGKVYDLNKVSDFSGTYAAGEASIAVGGGPGVVAMRNQHGVVIELKSVQQGAKLTMAAQGVEIQLKE
jgi:hypothetical protein